jgi:hypothetical protein
MGMSSNIYSAADSPKMTEIPSFVQKVVDQFVDEDSWEGKVHTKIPHQLIITYLSDPLENFLPSDFHSIHTATKYFPGSWKGRTISRRPA